MTRHPVTTASPPQLSRGPARPTGGNAIRMAFGDEAALQGVIADLGRARQKIQFESFLLNGAPGQRIAEALIARHAAGVAVQVLLDRLGSRKDGDRLATRMRAAGLDVRFYDTSRLDHGWMAVDHAKLVVIDDAVAWSGGVNFDAENNQDLMVRIEGPAVRRFQATFHEGWAGAGGRVLAVTGQPTARGDVWVGVAQTAPGERTTREQVLGELGTLGPGDRVDLAMMDLGDRAVLDALCAAHRRGVRLRIVIDRQVPFTNGGRWDGLLRAVLGGIPDLPAIRQLQQAGIAVAEYVPPPGIVKLHAKVWLFTRGLATGQSCSTLIGGSVNAIKGAYDFNHEVGFSLAGPRVGRGFLRHFERDIAAHARQIPHLGLWDSLKAIGLQGITRHLI